LTAEVERLINTQASLEAQMLSIESASMTSGIVQSVQVGMTAQKALAKNLDPEAVAQLQEDVSAHVDALDEVSRTLGLPLGTPFDDDDLSRQLDELTMSGSTESTVATGASASAINDSLNDDSQLESLENEILSQMPQVPDLAPMPQAPRAPPVLKKNSTATSATSADDEELARLAREMES